MQIAITGGSGRIGPAVIELALSQGHRVVSIDRAAPAQYQDGVPSGVTCIQADVTDYPTFEQALHGCEALIHPAAIPSPRKHPDHVVHNNNTGAFSIVRKPAACWAGNTTSDRRYVSGSTPIGHLAHCK